MVLIKKSIVLILASLLLLTLTPIWGILDSPSVDQEKSDIDNYGAVSDDMFTGSSRGIRLAKVESTKIAAEISDEGMKTAKAMLERAWTENITEAMAAKAIDDRMVELGSSSMLDAFGVLVISGNDSGVPGGHGDPDDDAVNQILPGEVVIVDIGARYNGYVSDITRTFFMGEPTEKQREIYQIIYEAQEAAFTVFKHGIPAGDVDKAARDLIESYGYGEEFSHCLGHGIGLQVHIPPTLCPDEQTQISKLRDDIITIEPGIYFEGDFGIRIEDDLIVEWFGYQIITSYPRDIEDMIIHGPQPDIVPIEPEEKSWWETTAGRRTLAAGAGLSIAGAAALFVLYNKKRKNTEEKVTEERIDKD